MVKEPKESQVLPYKQYRKGRWKDRKTNRFVSEAKVKAHHNYIPVMKNAYLGLIRSGLLPRVNNAVTTIETRTSLDKSDIEEQLAYYFAKRKAGLPQPWPDFY